MGAAGAGEAGDRSRGALAEGGARRARLRVEGAPRRRPAGALAAARLRTGAAEDGAAEDGAATGPDATRPAALSAGMRSDMLPSGRASLVSGQLRNASIAPTKTRQQSAATIREPPAPAL